MVQVRWDHLNRDASLLTKSQAIFLDGHFVIEHTARNRSGRFMHFNGTAGVWRRTTIDDGGGWQHDTLTEDLDLSLSLPAQGLAVRLPPAVLRPGRAAAGDDRLQAAGPPLDQGLVADRASSCCPRSSRASTCSTRIKSEAFFHLTNTVVYPLMVHPDDHDVSRRSSTPTARSRPQSWSQYIFSAQPVRPGDLLGQHLLRLQPARAVRQRGRLEDAALLPVLMGLGVGISLNNAKAVFEAIWGAIRKQAQRVRPHAQVRRDRQAPQRLEARKMPPARGKLSRPSSRAQRQVPHP